jgi:hypothetical protein
VEGDRRTDQKRSRGGTGLRRDRAQGKCFVNDRVGEFPNSDGKDGGEEELKDRNQCHRTELGGWGWGRLHMEGLALGEDVGGTSSPQKEGADTASMRKT